jgi:hypothetical protein
MVAAKRWLVLAFLAVAAPVGLTAAVLMPSSQVPDEATHTARAAGLLRGAVLANRVWTTDPAMGDYAWEAGVKASVPLVRMALTNTTQPPLTGRKRLKPLNLKLVFFWHLPNTAMYFPAAYVPAALGMALVAALHGSAPIGFVAARLGALAAYLALGSAALALAVYGEGLLLAVLLLPTPLLLAGSVNQDGVLIALTCFAVAALTRNGAGWRRAGLAGLVLLVLAKPPYALLLGLYALTPGAEAWRARAAALLAGFAAVGVWVALTAALVIVPFEYYPPGSAQVAFYHPGPLYPGNPAAWFFQMDPAAQLAGLAAHPLAAISVVLRTLAAWRPAMFFELIGRYGPLALPVSAWLGAAWALALAVSLAGGRPSRQGLAAGLLILGSFWAVMLSLYIDNTPVGAVTVEGVFARYVLPLAPCLILVFPGPARTWAVAAVLAVGLFDAAYFPLLIWRAYGG